MVAAACAAGHITASERDCNTSEPGELPAARGLFQKGLGQPHMLLLALTFAVFPSKTDTLPMFGTRDKAQGSQVAQPLTRRRWTRATSLPPMSQRNCGRRHPEACVPRPADVRRLTRGGGFSVADCGVYGVYGPGFGLRLPQLLDMESDHSSRFALDSPRSGL